MLMRMLVMATVTQRESGGSDTLLRYAASQLVTVERLLSAKCYEYLKLLEEYAKKCARRGDELGRAQGLKLEAVVEHVRADPNYAIGEWLRNKLTNHFDLSEIGQLLDRPPVDQRVTIFLHEQDGNSLYPLGDELAFMGKMNERGAAIEDYAAWRDWTLETCRVLLGVHHAFMIDLLHHFFPEKGLVETRVHATGALVGEVGNTALPMFFDFVTFNRELAQGKANAKLSGA